MKCLSDEIIQIFIDGELSGKDRDQVISHISSCEECAERVSEQRDLALRYKESMNSLFEPLPEIPGFDQSIKKRTISRRRVYMIVYLLAAALILSLFLVLPLERNTEDFQEIIVENSFSGEIDANLPLSDQEFEITFYNEEGRKIN